MDDFYRDVREQVFQYNRILTDIGFHIDSYVDLEFDQKYLEEEIDSEEMRDWSDAHLREAESLLERALVAWENTEIVKEYAESSFSTQPPTEPLAMQQERHRYILMRYIGVLEGVDDAEFKGLPEILESDEVEGDYSELIPEET